MTTAPRPPHRLRRSLALGVLTASATVSALLAAPAANAQQAEPQTTPARAAGENRFDTARLLATLEFDAPEDVFIAFGRDFADALAGSFAAGRAGVEKGPILLSGHRDLTAPTRAALDELNPRRVFVLGGPSAIHPDVVSELESRGYDEVVRIAGRDRYETAAEIAFAFGTGPYGDIGTLDGQRTALLASGASFADALAAGPIAARAEFPLLLTPRDRAHFATDQRLEDLGIERIVVIGEIAAVSADVAAHYEQQGYTVERWGGADRNETAAVVAENARLRLGFDASLTLLARGDAFPDALAASIHAARNAAPILLTLQPDTLSTPTRDWLAARCPGVDVIRALGGTAAITDATLQEAVNAAESCSTSEPGRTQQSYIQAPQEARSDSAGTTFEVTVSGFAEAENPAPVDIALFPCEAAQPTNPDDNTFADADGDGRADAIGTTSTGSAVISSLHGDATSTTHLDAVQPDAQDQIRYAIRSDAEDCAVNVVFHDANGNNQLDVDDQGRPLEHWNYGLHEWTGGQQGRTEQSYIQSPQEARSASPGTTFDVTVLGFDAANPAPVDIALFPCSVAAPTDPNNNTFLDSNNDGFADALGTTTTDSAVISSVHGEPGGTRHVDAVQPNAENQIPYALSSSAEDCAVNVVFHDANGNNQLDVDDQGRPLEHWNYGLHEWVAGS